TADLRKHVSASRAGGGRRCRRRWRQQPHEEGELRRIAEGLQGRGGAEPCVILRRPVEEAVARLVAFGLEELVRHPLFNVVGPAGEDQQGLLLRLPAESRDAAVITAGIGAARSLPIRLSPNAHGGTTRSRRLQVRENGRIRDLLDQAGSEGRGGNAKD